MFIVTSRIDRLKNYMSKNTLKSSSKINLQLKKKLYLKVSFFFVLFYGVKIEILRYPEVKIYAMKVIAYVTVFCVFCA